MRPGTLNLSVLVRVAAGRLGTVWMSREAFAGYKQAIGNADIISMKRKRHLERFFNEFCNNVGHEARLGGNFKKEGNFSAKNGAIITIWAFRAFNWSLYGTTLQVDERRNFVGVEVETEEIEGNGTNHALIEMAAMKLSSLLEYER